MIKTTYLSERDLIKAIKTLYIGERFHLDPTYSKGVTHRGQIKPKLISDIAPAGDYLKADCRDLPYKSNTIESIFFDPPFLAGGGKTGIMHARFSSFNTVDDLLEFYDQSLTEMYRLLMPGGFLVFKCQDLMNGRTQTFSHCEIYNGAVFKGFYARDLFVYIKENRAKTHNTTKQHHARKTHCYYWVFQKNKRLNKRIGL